MTRSKVKLAWIQKKSSRKSTFKNRSEGLLMKVEQLCILCDLHAFVIIYNPDTEELTVWPNHQEVEQLLRRFMRLPDFTRRRKMKDQESHMEEIVAHMQVEQTRVLKKNKEMELNDVIGQIERKGKFFHEFSHKELTDLDSFLKEKIVKQNNKILRE
ncbi:agamous-like MADS-box protein AGL92 [Rosa sericea]